MTKFTDDSVYDFVELRFMCDGMFSANTVKPLIEGKTKRPVDYVVLINFLELNEEDYKEYLNHA